MIQKLTSIDDYEFYSYNYLVMLSDIRYGVFIVIKEVNRVDPSTEVWGLRSIGSLQDIRHDLLRGADSFGQERTLLEYCLQNPNKFTVYKVAIDLTPVFLGILYAARNPQSELIQQIADNFEQHFTPEFLDCIDTLDF